MFTSKSAKWIITMSLFLLLVLLPCLSFADEHSGDLNGIHWELDNRGTLSFTSEKLQELPKTGPWEQYKNSVKTIVFGNGIAKLKRLSFDDYSNLTTVSFGPDLEEIDIMVFQNAWKINKFILLMEKDCFQPRVSHSHAAEVELGEDSPYILENGIVYNKNKDTVIYGNISGKAIIPEGVTHISKYAFASCKITEVVLPETLTHIGSFAFDDCRELKAITFPKSLKYIGDTAFDGCRKLKNITFLCDSITLDTDSVNGIFRDCRILEEVTIPECKQIPAQCFMSCEKLKKVILHEGTLEIGKRAFAECQSLKEIYIPDSVKKIADDAIGYSAGFQISCHEGSYAESFANSYGFACKLIKSVTAINLSESSATIQKGKTADIKAAIEPEDATNPTVEWFSSDESIVTVNKGKIKANACGECDIICKATDGSGVLAVCHVSVIQMVQSIQVKEKKATIPFGESYKPEITIKPDDATDKSLSWSSSNPNVCSVNEIGEIYANGAGVCDITGIANDGSGKNVTIQVSVPVFSTPEFSYTISEKGETCIPIDLNKADISIISYKSNNQNILLYYLDEQGLHIYPIKEGNTSITLSNKNDSKDKSIISLTIENSAVCTESDPLQAYIVLEKAKVDAGETIKASYAICGGKAPYTIIDCYGRCQMSNGSVNGTPHREAKNSSGSVSLKVLPGSVEVWLELSVKDADGNVIKAESTHAKVKRLQVSYDCSYVIAARNEPMEITFSVTGGSGNYTAEIQWDIFGNNGEDGIRNIHKETKKINDKGAFSYTPLSGYGVECFITIKDSKNPNLLIRNSNPRGAVLADGWSLKVTNDQPIATQGEPFYIDLHFIGKSPDILETCYWRFRSEDGTNGETIEINSSDYIKKEDDILSISYTPSSKGTLCLYLNLSGYDKTFITRSIAVE